MKTFKELYHGEELNEFMYDPIKTPGKDLPENFNEKALNNKIWKHIESLVKLTKDELKGSPKYIAKELLDMVTALKTHGVIDAYPELQKSFELLKTF